MSWPDCYTDSRGLTFCADHRLERCPQCCMDFTTMNQYACEEEEGSEEEDGGEGGEALAGEGAGVGPATRATRSNTPGRVCRSCHARRPRAEYSKSQWAKGRHAACSACLAAASGPTAKAKTSTKGTPPTPTPPDPCPPAPLQAAEGSTAVPVPGPAPTPAPGGQRRCTRPTCAQQGPLRCSRCKAPYCSPACQKAHWGQHKGECRAGAERATPQPGPAPGAGTAPEAPAPEAPAPVGAYRCKAAGCDRPGKLQCGRCKAARYCGPPCQKAHWKQHKGECRADEGMATFGVGDNRLLDALEAGASGAWHQGLSRRRLFDRLIESFQLRVEDEYCYQGNLIGAYAAGAGGCPEDTEEEFRDYVHGLKAKGMLPAAWDAGLERQLWAEASTRVHYALEKSDIVKKYGYSSSEHMVLRSMAEAVFGSLQSW